MHCTRRIKLGHYKSDHTKQPTADKEKDENRRSINKIKHSTPTTTAKNLLQLLVLLMQNDHISCKKGKRTD